MASPELSRIIADLADDASIARPETLEDERRAWDAICARLDPIESVQLERVEADGPGMLALAPAERGPLEILYCHGGAFALGSGWNYRGMLSRWAAAAGVRVWTVDYRLAPESPYPAALEDIDAAYNWLLARSESGSVLLAGDSCGANLALGAAIRARDRGEVLPAALVCLSPWVDLTLSGDSLFANADTDPSIDRDGLAVRTHEFLGDVDPGDPNASPLFADLRGLPQTLIQVGAGEALLADFIALGRAAAAVGAPVTLEIVPDVIHVWQLWAGRVPESSAAVARLAEFTRRVASAA